MNKKTYPQDITDEVAKIATALDTLFKNQKSNLRNIARFASISVNSVKSVLAGKTANIASYSLIAKALGTTLTDVIYNIKATELKGAAPQATVVV
jgi:lambda repressor-like predicted transcriptional regulator